MVLRPTQSVSNDQKERILPRRPLHITYKRDSRYGQRGVAGTASAVDVGDPGSTPVMSLLFSGLRVRVRTSG